MKFSKQLCDKIADVACDIAEQAEAFGETTGTIRGIALGLAEAHRYGASDKSVQMAARAAGLTLKEIKAAGVEPFDWKELKKAGVPAKKEKR